MEGHLNAGLSMAERGVRPEESRRAKVERHLAATARRFRPVVVASGRTPGEMNIRFGIRNLDRVGPVSMRTIGNACSICSRSTAERAERYTRSLSSCSVSSQGGSLTLGTNSRVSCPENSGEVARGNLQYNLGRFWGEMDGTWG